MTCKFADVKIGDTLIVNGKGAFECMRDGEEKEVFQDDDGDLCVHCDAGEHCLKPNVDAHGDLPEFDLKPV